MPRKGGRLALFPARPAKQGAQRGRSDADAALLSRESRPIGRTPCPARRSSTARCASLATRRASAAPAAQLRSSPIAGLARGCAGLAICLCRTGRRTRRRGSAWTVDGRHVEPLRCREGAFDLELLKAILGRTLIDRWELWRPAIHAALGPGVDPMFEGLVEKLGCARDGPRGADRLSSTSCPSGHEGKM